MAQHFVLARFPRRMVWDPTFAFGVGSRDFDQFKQMFVRYGKATFLPGRGNLERKFNDWCEFALSQSNCMSFVDEPAMLGGPSKLPQSFIDLHRLGHKRGVGMTIASHSVWDLPHVTQQTDHLFVFRISRIVDVNALRQLVPEEAIEKIRTLPNRYFYYQNNEGGTFYRPIPKRPRTPATQQVPSTGV